MNILFRVKRFSLSKISLPPYANTAYKKRFFLIEKIIERNPANASFSKSFCSFGR